MTAASNKSSRDTAASVGAASAESNSNGQPQKTPIVLDLPVGLDATGTRHETDSMGGIDVPADRYWGAQTQRSLVHFSIGNDRMPHAVYHAYGYVKKAAAIVNGQAGRLPQWKAKLIARVADEVIAGDLDEHFPLYVWQTGSGTQSNMNVNEVISNRAIQLTGGTLASKVPVHPNDDVNMGQSSNDTFPTAMHIATVQEFTRHLVPAAQGLQEAIAGKAREWHDVVKIGRTHLEDAVPLTVGQEWSGYATQLDQALDRRQGDSSRASTPLGRRAARQSEQGSTPPKASTAAIADEIAELTGHRFQTVPNKFAAQGGLDAMVAASAGLRALAVPLMKIANDIRWLASGPRCGIGELILPANEPGSSIMPGKVNPTQCEAMVMVCIQVLVRGQLHRVCRFAGQLRIECDAAHHHQQRAAFGSDPGRRLREAPGVLHRRDDAQQRKDRRVCRPVPDAGHRPVPGHRLRRSQCHRPRGRRYR